MDTSNMIKTRLLKIIKRDKLLYLMALPGLASLIVFKYFPMYGLLMSFQNFSPSKGILYSQWVGFNNIIAFVKDPFFTRTITNTFLIGIYSLIFGFPASIILALLFNELKNKYFKKIIQTVTYMPYFISVVIVVGLTMEIFSTRGVINDIFEVIGLKRVNFFQESQWFRPIYIVSMLWSSVGYGAIVYMAALSGIDIEQYESAIIDGANRFKQIIHITIPGIMTTITILFILSIGQVLTNDFVRILLMYNPLTYESADVIQTYVYRVGLEGTNYGYASAVGLFLSVISFLMLYAANKITKKIGDVSLW